MLGNWKKADYNGVFTLGHRETYCRALEEHDFVEKIEGGSVWRTYLQAEWHRLKNGLHDFAVFGVEADWDADTKPNEDPDASWRDLTRRGKIFILR